MQTNNFSGSVTDALSHLRKESLDIFNRLHSIEEDIAFVSQVRSSYPTVPLLPNLRCGSWYTDPKISSHVPAYFKSTDGHFNNWSFNLRRSNLHLLPLIINGNGLILVDSTRSGKRIPDALSKTVPIWCAVINRAMTILHPELIENSKGNCTWDSALYTPPGAVSRQEHSQIEGRLDEWAKSLADSSFSLPVLSVPLRPVWITPGTTTFPELDYHDKNRPFFPVICVSASKQTEDGGERRSSGFSFIQGSGDDHELWGMGLTPEMFWAHRNQLLGSDRDSLPSLVGQIVSQEKFSSQEDRKGAPTPVGKVDGQLLLCSVSDLPTINDIITGSEETAYLILSPSESGNQLPTSNPLISRIPLTPGKKGQAEFLQSALPQSVNFIHRQLSEGRRICVACETGKDSSVGVVLAALQLFFTDSGHLALPTSRPDVNITKHVDKGSIRTRLEWIIASRPSANPSRTTLKRVNEFLLTPPAFRSSKS